MIVTAIRFSLIFVSGRIFVHALLSGTGVVAFLAATASPAQNAQFSPRHERVVVPFSIERTVVIPDVPVWPYSDQLAVDLRGKRLFATPQGAKSVAAIDLDKGQVVKMITGIGNPHSIVYKSGTDQLFVVDGLSGEINVYNGITYELIGKIPVGLGADMAAYDARTGIFYVNNGGEKANLDYSMVSAIDTSTMKRLFDINLDALDVEGSTIDTDGQKLYVNLPDKFEIAVIDLKTRRQIATWSLPEGKHSPWAAAIDTRRQRLYVSCRDNYQESDTRGSIVVLDLKDGRHITTLPIGGWSDGIFLDEKRNRLYASAGVGQVEAFQIEPDDRFTRLSATETALLAKSSYFSKELDRLFVTAPNLGMGEARIFIMRPQS